ncbi:hypothetical protein AKJ57_02735 [candidate division MSBL1 archaeon SCGC-AAA259A05]|uniref:Uncharacterized protein n=1 Tax=candidate division MSBL1 archaeon SCGC-AAA259A05 TaxID=1698259 RepID=A0A133UA08_9EURY|nr:hypothetical protein AKJ57_02735 [candidate division MSBL1 archaeon SCGC-AAA259A05]
MLEFKPEREAKVWDRLRTLLPFCESVRHVDLDAHAKDHPDDSCPECRRAEAWYVAHGRQFFT